MHVGLQHPVRLPLLPLETSFKPKVQINSRRQSALHSNRLENSSRTHTQRHKKNNILIQTLFVVGRP